MSRWLNETTSQKNFPARISVRMRVRIFFSGLAQDREGHPGIFLPEELSERRRVRGVHGGVPHELAFGSGRVGRRRRRLRGSRPAPRTAPRAGKRPPQPRPTGTLPSACPLPGPKMSVLASARSSPGGCFDNSASVVPEFPFRAVPTGGDAMSRAIGPLAQSRRNRHCTARASRRRAARFPKNAVGHQRTVTRRLLYILLWRTLRLRGRTEDAGKVVLEHDPEGDYFGELVLDGGRRSASINDPRGRAAVFVIPLGTSRDCSSVTRCSGRRSDPTC